jgi:hypothetical protein
MPWDPSKPPRKHKEKSDLARASKPWRDLGNKFTMTNGVVKSSFIEFNIKRTRNSPALHFRRGQNISIVHGVNDYDVTVYSFTPRSSSGSDVAASGIIRLLHHDLVEWDMDNSTHR